jgi:thioredoxin reductase/NAD-dependent dihydropyrimidine dehydrogenase PreA subunit
MELTHRRVGRLENASFNCGSNKTNELFMLDPVSLFFYLIPMGLILYLYVRRYSGHHGSSVRARQDALEAGLTEPASLHPDIDPTKCTGCRACIAACPEIPGHQVIGLIHGKAELINPTDCIGHGACLTACPHGAITLVFGTERRGVDIPHVQVNFESNVPGIFIAGELGGMGLIRNAIEQGRQAVESIYGARNEANSLDLDLLIVGAGPAGFSASLAAMECGLSCVTVEQESLGGTVAHYPRGKIVMTAPVDLPIFGKVNFRETTKEKLLTFWEEVEVKTNVAISYKERVESVVSIESGFEIKTNKASYRAHAILLAIGRRGTPRKLGVPGEEQAKVIYHLIDPCQYKNQHVLVVGGGDSALEAAETISAVEGTSVTLSYRSNAFGRAKQKNRQKVELAEKEGRLNVIFNSNVVSIGADQVTLEQEGNHIELKNEAVIVSAGGILPTPFLQSLGIEVETKYGTA